MASGDTQMNAGKDDEIKKLQAQLSMAASEKMEQQDLAALIAGKDDEIKKLQAQLSMAASEKMEQQDLAALIAGKDDEIKKLQAQLSMAASEKMEQQDLAALIAGKDDEIKKLQAQLSMASSEKIELQEKDARQVLEIKSLRRKILELEPEVETDGRVQPTGNAPGTAGDVEQVLQLQQQLQTVSLNEDSLGVEKHVSLGGIQDGMPGMPEKITQGVITEDMITWLSENVEVKDWKPLVRKLGVTDQTCGDIVEANRGNMREQRYQAFLHWKKTTHSTVKVLLKAMLEKSLRQLAREFCKAHKLDLDKLLKKEPQGQMLPVNPARVGFKNDFQRFMHPFLKGDFSSFEKDLRSCGKLSVEQGKQFDGKSLEVIRQGNGFVDEVLKQWCGAYYLAKGSDEEFEKCKVLWKVLLVCGKDVREVFKKYVSRGGVIGPKEEDGEIKKLTYSTMQDIEELLSISEGMWCWIQLADQLKQCYPNVFEKVDNNKIRRWEKDPDPHKGAKSILEIWNTTTQAHVKSLYRLAVQNGRFDIARILE